MKVLTLYGGLAYPNKVKGYCRLHKCYLTARNIKEKGRCKCCNHFVGRSEAERMVGTE